MLGLGVLYLNTLIPKKYLLFSRFYSEVGIRV